MIETGIQFDNIHSFYDLNLVPAPFVIPPAKPKTSYIEVPGGDGSLDLTEAHGEVKFQNREFTVTFSVMPSDKMTFEEKAMQISNALNGKRFEKIIFDKDLHYYFTGRCTVDEHLQDKRLKQITVRFNVNPWKWHLYPTVAKFSLNATEKTIVLSNGRKSVVPLITCTGEANVTFEGTTYKLSAGTYKLFNIFFTEGGNELKLSGSGDITFEYQEGEL